MTIPSWLNDAIFYQIFPDRFANGDTSNDPTNVQPWGDTPTFNGFQGGDLKGIILKLDYLSDFGFTALYLNPIFLSPSTHRYNTTDYYQVDPKLGNLKDFQSLLDQAHSHKMHIILDGVFNHCGRGFFAFSDILENQRHSPYLDWFHIRHFPVRAYSMGEAKDYLGWWNHKSLPKFNTQNPQVRRYIMDVARYWIDLGIDGWRLDVPNEIDDDDFWAEFRQVVKTANPETYLLGEIWDGNPRWIGDSHFDGLMNYPIREAIFDLFSGKIKPGDFTERIQQHTQSYPQEYNLAMYNLLGSHDTIRVMTQFQKNLYQIKLAYLILFSLPGAPAIYYGDEIGIEGGKDPDCRRAFPWTPENWNMELMEWIRLLIRLRKNFPALRAGNYQPFPLQQENDAIVSFSRLGEKESILVLVNTSSEQQTLHINLQPLNWQTYTQVQDLINNAVYPLSSGNLPITLLPQSGAILSPIQ
jgi:cyclomaltodextrinase / maltogenic alpha-amylase / neopullulanase